jgi:folate-binding protein YgfZ
LRISDHSLPYRALREGAGIVDRSGRGRLRLTGTDRRAYLQGLLTNDIEALAAGAGCYAAYLTPQGRMISDMRVFETGEAILLDLEGHVAATVRDRLSQFIFSEDVEVGDLTASTVQPGVYGPAAAAVASSAIGISRSELEEMPAVITLRDSSGSPLYVVRSDDVGVAGFDVIAVEQRRQELLRAFRDAGAIDVDDVTAETCRIEAARPRFGVDMDENTIPLEAGIEDRAISLTKGCYVGQEIIIRVLHRGHGRVARRLVQLSFDAAAPVPPRGAAIRSGDREIGAVTSAAHSPALGRPIALGYVHRDFTAAGTAVIVGTHSASVAAAPLVVT